MHVSTSSHFLLPLLLLVIAACSGPSGTVEAINPSSDFESLNAIFPKGELGPPEWFTGKAYYVALRSADSTYKTAIGNVYFEPGARSNWHAHPAGQILLITDGVGYHQLEGEPRQRLQRGDVVKCPPNVKHWHGAAPDTGMQQLYLLPNVEGDMVVWMEPVTDQEYNEK